MASSYSCNDSSSSNRRYRRQCPAKRSTRSLDDHYLLHPMGRWRPVRYDGSGCLLSTTYNVLTSTSRSHRLSLFTSRPHRPRSIRHHDSRSRCSQRLQPYTNNPRRAWRSRLNRRTSILCQRSLHRTRDVGIRYRLALPRFSSHHAS